MDYRSYRGFIDMADFLTDEDRLKAAGRHPSAMPARVREADQRRTLADVIDQGCALTLKQGDSFDVREHASEYFPPTFPVRSDHDVEIHEGVALSIWGSSSYCKPPARYPAPPVRESRSSGYIDPNNPSAAGTTPSFAEATRALMAAAEGAALGIWGSDAVGSKR